MERKIIAIDCGKMNLKAKCGEQEIIYKNNYSLKHTDDALLGTNTFNVTYDNEDYTIGNNGSKALNGEGKESLIHIISALTAVTHFLDPEDDNDEIYLMYGESVDRYYNQEHKNFIKKNLEGSHEIMVGDKMFNFRIKHVHILPEGIGHILENLSKYTGMQYVVDIGGSTINFLSVMNGRPIEEESRSYPMGLHFIKAKVGKAINTAGLGRFKDTLIDEFMNNGCSNSKIQAIINNTIEDHFDEFDNELINLGVEIHKLLNAHSVVFIGGGSELFRNQIEMYYENATVIDEPLLANVRGFYTYGIAKFGNVSATTTKKRK